MICVLNGMSWLDNLVHYIVLLVSFVYALLQWNFLSAAMDVLYMRGSNNIAVVSVCVSPKNGDSGCNSCTEFQV